MRPTRQYAGWVAITWYVFTISSCPFLKVILVLRLINRPYMCTVCMYVCVSVCVLVSAFAWVLGHTNNIADKILSLFMCEYRQGMDWWMDLLKTYTHHSKLQVITGLSLISILYKSPQHPLSFLPACCIIISRSLTTASYSGDSSASRVQVRSSQTPAQNYCFN
jgi:hypothetical protein